MTQPQSGSSRLAALALGAILALAGFVVGHWLAEPPRTPIDPGGEALQDSRALRDSIQSLDARLARIESSLAIQASRGDRNPEPTHAPAPGEASSSSAGPASASAAAQDLQRELQLIEQRLDLISKTLQEEQRVHFQLPTIAQVRAAKAEVDWEFVDKVARTTLADPDSGRKLMRGMTFDEVLTRVGLPTRIAPDGPEWSYRSPQSRGSWTALLVQFAGDRVASVDVYVANGSR